ncbi:MAG: T9SS type A sorting domain-containing protein [Ignavibacteriales bacterium]|nr:T9SS type A sorting domain-containing protein [Ignavibacteriales bacterium]
MKNHFQNILLRNYRTILFAILLSQYTITFAQTINVSGKVTASRFPVKNVSITFIDNADTNLRYNTLTNEFGQYQIGLITSVASNNNSLPTSFTIGQSYPNPFSSSTSIPYNLSKQSKVEVSIYDVLGREVKKFEIGNKSNGYHTLFWNGTNNFGQKVANGIYFYKFSVDGENQIKKMVFNHVNNKIFYGGTSALLKSSEKVDNENLQKILSTNFSIRLENTENTSIYIEEQKLENVEIKNDTTINFEVNTISVASINDDSLHQIIRGFGASNILLWRPDMTSGEIETAFGTDDGQLGFTILRIMVEADSNRWGLNLPTVNKALEKGATIIASPWHAPSDLAETVNGVSRVKHDMYADYAEHLNAFTKFMNDNGVPLYGISIQNEPDITDQWTSWTIDEMFTFMKDYAHLIEGTNVMAPESFQFRRNMSDPILNDSIACANTDIVCGHIYGGGLFDYPLAREKGKEVWMTEYLINSPGSGANMDTSWNAAMETAKSINNCMNANMNSYVWWYLVRYYGPICDGTYLRKGEVTKKGYAMSQFSRFIRPGFYRIESSISPTTSSVEISAYKDPNTSKIVIVAINTSGSDIEQTFRLSNSENIAFTPYTSSLKKDCEAGNQIISSEGLFKITLGGESITTLVSE